MKMIKFCLAGCLMSWSTLTLAQTWTGGAGTTDWFDADNWSTGTLPNQTTTTEINLSATATSPVVISEQEAFAKELKIATTVDSALLVDNNGKFFATNGIVPVIGDKARGTLLITNGYFETSGSDKNIILGNSASGFGRCVVSANSTLKGSNATHIRVGNNGTGELWNAGSVSASRHLYLGTSVGSTGTVWNTDGTIAIEREIYVGNSGDGMLYCDAPISGRNVYIGNNTGSCGRVSLTSSLKYSSALSIGEYGHGEIFLRGGVLNGSSSPILTIRTGESGFGLLQGWGSTTNSGTYATSLRCNGLLIADGEGQARDLNLSGCLGKSGTTPSFANLIENTTTNGLYAINKGRLILGTNDTVDANNMVYTWGESQADETIDLVNSARLSFSGISSKTAVRGELLAIDRSEVPAYSGGNLISVWRMIANKDFTDVSLQVRFDHVAAGSLKLRLLRYNETSTQWTEMPSTVNDGYILQSATVWVPQGTDRIGLFAIAAYDPRSSILLY